MSKIGEIPNINCPGCGRRIQAWRYVKKGITRVKCNCGTSYRLVKAGKPIFAGSVTKDNFKEIDID